MRLRSRRRRQPCWPQPTAMLQAQATPAPVLKKSAPPLRGTAELGFVQSAKLDGNMIVTTFQVKNLHATNAIVGLQITEFWYDKAGAPLQGTGDRQRLRAPLQPLDVATITLRSPKVPGMTSPQYKFEQNNGIGQTGQAEGDQGRAEYLGERRKERGKRKK